MRTCRPDKRHHSLGVAACVHHCEAQGLKSAACRWCRRGVSQSGGGGGGRQGCNSLTYPLPPTLHPLLCAGCERERKKHDGPLISWGFFWSCDIMTESAALSCHIFFNFQNGTEINLFRRTFFTFFPPIVALSQ